MSRTSLATLPRTLSLNLARGWPLLKSIKPCQWIGVKSVISDEATLTKCLGEMTLSIVYMSSKLRRTWWTWWIRWIRWIRWIQWISSAKLTTKVLASTFSPYLSAFGFSNSPHSWGTFRWIIPIRSSGWRHGCTVRPPDAIIARLARLCSRSCSSLFRR